MAKRKINIGRNTINSKRKRLALKNEAQKESESTVTDNIKSNLLKQKLNESSADRNGCLPLDKYIHSSQQEIRSLIVGQSQLSSDETSCNSLRNSRKLTTNHNLWLEKAYSAMNYNPSIDYKNDPSVSIGKMSIVCKYCSALKWKNETKSMCCLNGRIKLEDIQPPPEPMKSLLTGDHPKSKQFMRNIRRYNSCFQMTSFMSTQIFEPGYMPTFKIQGQVYHLAGSLLPYKTDNHKFLQIYFISDYETQVSTRCKIAPQYLDNALVKSLQDMLYTHNRYVIFF